MNLLHLTRAKAEAIIRCEVLRSEFAHYSSNAKKRESEFTAKKRESEFTTGNLARVKGVNVDFGFRKVELVFTLEFPQFFLADNKSSKAKL